LWSIKVRITLYLFFCPKKLLSNIDSFNTIKIINDSDHLFGVSLAKRSQEIDWYYLPLQADIYSIGNWWKNYDSLISDLLSSTKIRWHFRPVTEEKWALIEAAGDIFLRRAAIVREVRYLLTEIDKGKDFITSTNIIKYALSRNLLSKVVRGRSGGIVFIPIDWAFHKEKFYDNSHGLLEVDSTIKLLIKAHYFPSKNITQIVKPRNNNQLYELLKCYGIEVNFINNEVLVGINSSRIIKEPIIIGHQLVCFIDRLLLHTQPILSNAFLA
jgi:hypothetical protein